MSWSKRRRGGQPGPRPLRVSEFAVVGPFGEKCKIYARELREWVPGTEIERKQVVYEMGSGERVEVVDRNTFVSSRTGKKFTRFDR